MSKYYVKVDNGTNCKNNAEKAVDAYVKTHDGTLLPSVQAKEDFKKEVRNHVIKLNGMYKRCGDVPVSVWKSSDITTNIGFGGICYIRIYKVVQER
ncbi:MAG: hypothetical protein PHO36_15560 [Parabacteroides sp.]|nr:hypothetical protein [Parabacteroides sp.]